jgi:hypothetical protein
MQPLTNAWALDGDLQRLQRRADEVIAGLRAAIVAVARALQERRFLAGDAVRSIFEATPPSQAAVVDKHVKVR